MKIFGIVVKIVAALAAIAGIAFVVIKYGDAKLWDLLHEFDSYKEAKEHRDIYNQNERNAVCRVRRRKNYPSVSVMQFEHEKKDSLAALERSQDCLHYIDKYADKLLKEELAPINKLYTELRKRINLLTPIDLY